jgi:nitrate reductase gamma subunit
MSLSSSLFTLLYYLAISVLVIGLIYKIRLYATTPTPLRIPTTPAPTTRSGVILRLFFEVTLFNSLFKSNKWIWLFGWIFHAGLLLVLLRHLRYITDPVWGWVAWVQPFGKYAAFAMLFGLLGLWARRFLVDRVRYISAPSDHLMLLLLICIGLSGVGMQYISHTDIVSVKAFVLGLIYFDWQPMPLDLLLGIHLFLVALLMVIFPFSKLLHAPGLFFSPTRNQIDNSREKRHNPSWASDKRPENGSK